MVQIEYKKTVRHWCLGIYVIYKPQALSSALASLVYYSRGLQDYKLHNITVPVSNYCKPGWLQGSAKLVCNQILTLYLHVV